MKKGENRSASSVPQMVFTERNTKKCFAKPLINSFIHSFIYLLTDETLKIYYLASACIRY